ncbi:DUF6759 domain-containing protein [Chryseobacterium populi]|uniref:DUF6759 domain-containing protein n=1 Tax=Chryseobacterium populi TaxID=1144316 RepID=J2KG20_9FLAO|nr:DUF6759 domain-containing protein [Chryseobacterium populi]EJL72068.1 hypothetical protein PMI13_02059 [Chryseobacterium populi]
MKKAFLFSGFTLAIIVSSCNANYNTGSPIKRPYPRTTSSTSSASQTEREYSALIKTYKPETAEVLTDLLNDSSDSPKTSVTIENKSRCNMVITISGNNYFKKIPIGAGKIGSAMVLKNQNYNLSGRVCESVYQKTKFITSSYNIKLSN